MARWRQSKRSTSDRMARCPGDAWGDATTSSGRRERAACCTWSGDSGASEPCRTAFVRPHLDGHEPGQEFKRRYKRMLCYRLQSYLFASSGRRHQAARAAPYRRQAPDASPNARNRAVHQEARRRRPTSWTSSARIRVRAHKPSRMVCHGREQQQAGIGIQSPSRARYTTTHTRSAGKYNQSIEGRLCTRPGCYATPPARRRGGVFQVCLS